MNRNRFILAGAALLTLLACRSAMEPQITVLPEEPAGPEGPTGPVPDSPFMTDTTAYIARRIDPTSELAIYRFTVVTRFQNRGAVPLYLGRCYPNSKEPLFSVNTTGGAGTQSAYAQNWACVGHDQQFEIQPGAIRVDTIQVHGPNAFDGRTKVPFGVLEGMVRVFFDVRLTRGDGAPVASDAVRYSNAFVVRTAKE